MNGIGSKKPFNDGRITIEALHLNKGNELDAHIINHDWMQFFFLAEIIGNKKEEFYSLSEPELSRQNYLEI